MTEITCVICPKGCRVYEGEDGSFTGAGCERGIEYAKSELRNPVRTVTSTVKINGARLERLPVKTDRPVSKDWMLRAVRALNDVQVSAPVKVGDVVLQNALGTGADFVAAKTMDAEGQ